MKTYLIDSDIPVFGKVVPTFPSGIQEAFDGLIQSLPGGFDRPFFGISRVDGNNMQYIAAALEKSPDEGRAYSYDSYSIEQGYYAVTELKSWRQKKLSINGVFVDMIKNNSGIDLRKPCVEWYFDEDTMWCMMKLKATP